MLAYLSLWLWLAGCITLSEAHTPGWDKTTVTKPTVTTANPTLNTDTHSFTSTVLTSPPTTTTTIQSGNSTSSPSGPDSTSNTASLTRSFVLPTSTRIATKNPKRGLAFASGDTPGDIINANQSASVISWQYNWANFPPDYLVSSNLSYIPMQWGSGEIENFRDAVVAQHADTILAFNEPDYDRESNMDPVEAAHLWMQYLEPLKTLGVRLGGPAVTASPTGRPWIEAFLRACSNCTIDFLPIHWYGTGVEGFYGYIWDVHETFPQYPIWITEYADISTDENVVANFLNQTIVYLDSLDWIERYAWFGYFRPRPNARYNLLRDDGGLNRLGSIYTEAETIRTQIVNPLAGYKKADGADLPAQPPATTWAAFALSGTSSRANRVAIISFVTALSGCAIGALMLGL